VGEARPDEREIDFPGAERTAVTDFGAQQSHDDGSGLPTAVSGGIISPKRPVIWWMSVKGPLVRKHYGSLLIGRDAGVGFETSKDQSLDERRAAMLFGGGFTFANFVADLLAVFMFILWFWLLIAVSSDLFRRHDVSGFGKVLWVILLIVLPYIGIFAYIVTQGRGMAERNEARVKQARDDLRQSLSFSVADEIEKLDRLKTTGKISEQEYGRLRARIVQ
jgi:hypothetical protein